MKDKAESGRAGGGGKSGRTRLRQRWGGLPPNLRGALWLLLASALFSLMVALIKQAGKTLHVTEILLFRQGFMLLLALPAIARDFPGSLKSHHPGLQLVRIAAAVSAMLLSFTAFIHLPLAEAVTIGFARTFFITIFAILILQEVVGVRRWSAMVIGFAGVIIVAQPGVGAGLNIYGLMAAGGAACAALVMIIIRILSQSDRPITILSYQAIGVGLLMLPPALWFWRTPSVEEIRLLAAIGGVSVLAQLCNIYAFRAGEASAIAPLDYARLVWATLLGFLIFSEWPQPHVFAGAAIIIAAGVYTMYRERKVAGSRTGGPSEPPL
ncbi:MAG: DMT family transporter [Methyloligellaceae bacterium]